MVRDADNYALSVPVNLPRMPFAHPTSSRGGLTNPRYLSINCQRNSTCLTKVLAGVFGLIMMLMLILVLTLVLRIDSVFVQGVENWKDFIGFFSLRSYDTLQVD